MSVMPKMATKNPSQRSARILSKGRRLKLTKSVARKWSEIMESPGYTGWSNSEFAEHLLLSAVNKTSPVASSTSSCSGRMTTINVKDSVFKKWRDSMMLSGFNLSTDSEFAEALLNSLEVKNKVVRAQVASSSFPSSATSSSTTTSTVCDAKNQNQIFINVDIMGIDADQSSLSEGASVTATGNPVPKVIVTSFDPKADSFEAAFSKAAESQSSATKASSEDDRRTNSNDPEVVDVENNCDVSNSKVSSWCESTESSCSSSDIDVVEVQVVSPPKSKKEVCVDTLLADLTGAFVDPLGEETLFGAVLTNYQNKLCQVEGSLQKIKQEEKKGETTLKLKTAKEKLLRKELDALRKEISEENRHLEELQKKKDLMFTEKRSLQYKVLHCETLKSEHESKKARLK